MSRSCSRMQRIAGQALLLLAFVCVVQVASAQGTQADYDRAAKLRGLTQGKVFKTRVQPRWFDGNDRFWYRNDLPGGKREFVLVDAKAGQRKPAFDHAKLAAGLSKALGREIGATELPIDNMEFKTGEGKVVLTVQRKAWLCDLKSYEVKPSDAGPAAAQSLENLGRPRPSRTGGEQTDIILDNQTAEEVQVFWNGTDGVRVQYGSLKPGERRTQNTYAGHVWIIVNARGRVIGVYEATEVPGTAIIDGKTPGRGTRGGGGPQVRRGDSPDGKTTALVKDFNVWLRDKETGQEAALTTDGKADDFYTETFWSPDSKKLVALKMVPAQEHKIWFVESSPKDQLQPKLHTLDYLKPGDKVAQPKPHLFDAVLRTEIPVADSLFTNSFDLGSVQWSPDSSRFTFVYNERGHQVLRVLSADAKTGVVTPIVDETSKTFIDYSGKFFLQFLDPSGELIWMSERDGWCHLYLYDSRTGKVKNQITKGEWVVRGVDRVDPEKRQIWFRAGGIVPGQDPYYMHYCRVNFDGSGLVDLTPGDGTHTMAPSPDGRYYVDTYSRVDLPPVNELRRIADGKLVCELEKADASALLETGWKMPERFVAKGRDGKTDIYGVIWRPTNYDLNKKYPVIEAIYAGPQGAFTPKAWSSFYGQQENAELGFILVQMDGMGTSDRSKAFHDVCWKNLGDAGFPDRILWMKAAAAKDPAMDITRVGIYGGSAGGQNAMGALLFHPEFYKVGIADCGCHDNRMDKIWWNEQWMGWPIGPEYAASSNVVNADKLQGKLFLIVGEMDSNVDPASTMQVVNALIKADKDFDLLVVPGGGHCPGGSPYGARRQKDFFVRHLLGVEPRAK
jgi:dipeptidyl-peptidase-4